jgi:hypothetical protein
LRQQIYFFFLISLLSLVFGCSQQASSPLTPSENLSSNELTELHQADLSGLDSSNREILGMYQIRLFDDGTYEVGAARLGEIHADVTKMLFPPKCLDCFIAELTDVVGEIWNFDFTIRNPSNLTGYDCRVVLLNLAGLTILNPSSYTEAFAYPDDSDPINPFVVFDTGNGQNKWIPGASATTPVTILRPSGTKFSEINFVIDACYPGNQQDPYRIAEMTAEPPTIDTDGSDSTSLFLNVYDWQSNVNYVTIDLTPIGGSSETEMVKGFGNSWTLSNVSYKPGGLGPGKHQLLVTASSSNQKTYNYLNLLVTGDAEPFSVEIEQSTVSVLVGEDVDFNAVVTGGLAPYYHEWDLDYNGISFTPDTDGEEVTWDWVTPGTYAVKLRSQDYAGTIAYADSQIKVVVTMEPKIVVVLPDGGEIWPENSVQEIKWSSMNFDGTVFIEYSKDDFVSDIHSIASDVPNTGSYFLLKVPYDPTANAKVRISSSDFPSIWDVSNSAFTMTPQPHFNILTPNGGEEWLVGSSHEIKWGSEYVVGTVDLQYSKDNFDADFHSIALGIPNTGSYLWEYVPDDISDSVKIRIKISSDPGINDVSDNCFCITDPYICIASPNGGEEWYEGTDHLIEWETLGVSGNVMIEYSKDSFLTDIHQIVANTPNTGSFLWENIPMDMSDTVLVRVTSISEPTIKDTSDNFFSLTGPWIAVTCPNGGEQWVVYYDGLVQWASDPSIVNVVIKLSLDNGNTYPITITDSTPNDGIFIWQDVPLSASTDWGKVKIIDVDDPSVFDITDMYFDIHPPFLVVTAPNGYEQWLADSTHDITWFTAYVSGKLKIEYSKDNFVSDLHLVATDVTDSGSYSWQVPNDYSNNLKIRVTSLDFPMASDVSNYYFAILMPTIKVLAPNGGEKFSPGNSTSITWNSTNLPGEVAIYYSKDDFVSDINMITGGTYNYGNLQWIIPDDISNTIKVRVISVYDANIYDTSDNYFEIQ